MKLLNISLIVEGFFLRDQNYRQCSTRITSSKSEFTIHNVNPFTKDHINKCYKYEKPANLFVRNSVYLDPNIKDQCLFYELYKAAEQYQANLELDDCQLCVISDQFNNETITQTVLRTTDGCDEFKNHTIIFSFKPVVNVTKTCNFVRMNLKEDDIGTISITLESEGQNLNKNCVFLSFKMILKEFVPPNLNFTMDLFLIIPCIIIITLLFVFVSYACYKYLFS